MEKELSRVKRDFLTFWVQKQFWQLSAVCKFLTSGEFGMSSKCAQARLLKSEENENVLTSMFKSNLWMHYITQKSITITDVHLHFLYCAGCQDMLKAKHLQSIPLMRHYPSSWCVFRSALTKKILSVEMRQFVCYHRAATIKQATTQGLLQLL